MSQVILKQLDAIVASMQAVLAQVDAARQLVTLPPSAVVSQPALPERCQGIAADRCAMQDGELQRTFGLSQCSACRHAFAMAEGE